VVTAEYRQLLEEVAEHDKRILKSKLSSLVAVKKGMGVTDEDL